MMGLERQMQPDVMLTMVCWVLSYGTRGLLSACPRTPLKSQEAEVIPLDADLALSAAPAVRQGAPWPRHGYPAPKG